MNVNSLFSSKSASASRDAAAVPRSRRSERRRLALLVQVKPFDPRPVLPAWDAAAAQGGTVTLPRNLAERLEAAALKGIVILFILACLGCGLSAQRIAYLRARKVLGNQVRQREIEIQQLTQAYRSLAGQLAQQAAREPRAAELPRSPSAAPAATAGPRLEKVRYSLPRK